MKVIKKTNLVPVKAGNRIFGVRRDRVRKMLQEGSVTLYNGPFPDDVETFDVPTPPLGDDTPKAQSEPADKAPAEPNGDVEIPDGWEGEAPLSRIALAKRILGVKVIKSDDKKPTEAADDIIRQEVARRAAAAKSTPAENAPEGADQEPAPSVDLGAPSGDSTGGMTGDIAQQNGTAGGAADQKPKAEPKAEPKAPATADAKDKKASTKPADNAGGK